MGSIGSLIVTIATLIALFENVDSAKKPFRIEECNNPRTETLAALNKVEIPDCYEGMEDEKCILKLGSSKSISIEFTPKTRLESVKVAIYGRKFLIPMPFNLKPDEACGNYGLNCPLEPNVPARFTLELPILQEYPRMFVQVQIKLSSEDKPILCIQFDSEIK